MARWHNALITTARQVPVMLASLRCTASLLGTASYAMVVYVEPNQGTDVITPHSVGSHFGLLSILIGTWVRMRNLSARTRPAFQNSLDHARKILTATPTPVDRRVNVIAKNRRCAGNVQDYMQNYMQNSFASLPRWRRIYLTDCVPNIKNAKILGFEFDH
jgi:hypothetical protein